MGGFREANGVDTECDDVGEAGVEAEKDEGAASVEDCDSIVDRDGDGAAFADTDRLCARCGGSRASTKREANSGNGTRDDYALISERE